ncbi:MAG: hypothetical protein J7K58_05825 [Euryarchaeota archaeon]|nr:hypothetical protein [Euryarchaeota archaeon]
MVYFDKPGKENTDTTLKLAKERAEELGIKDVIIASTTGYTARKALEVFSPRDYNLVVVTHCHGFREPNRNEFPEDLREELINKGVKVLTTTHALSGSVERAIRKQLGTWMPVEIIANTLRIFGEGMKVVVEIVLMAADAGLIRTDTDVLAIAGTERGADTAVVLRPEYTFKFFDLEIKEIICMPRSKR